MSRVGFITGLLCLASLGFAGSPYEDARALYHRTDYDGAIRLLAPMQNRDARTWALYGMALFGKTAYGKATDAFEHAVELEPHNGEYVHWLGKCWGRRAESANPFLAPTYASRARTQFEKAVLLDPSNKEALNDLFDYYMEAPSFLGGGDNRAQALIDRIAKLEEAEGYYARAQLADKRKQYDVAEQCLRRAMELAPRFGRVIDLAKYVSKLGRVQESEAYFAQAEKMAPGNPRILFERAHTYIRDKRNLSEARELLKKYLSSSITADDPPKEQAQELLRRAGA